MPKAKRKRLTSRKDYNRVLLNAKEAKKAARDAARVSAKCTASDNVEMGRSCSVPNCRSNYGSSAHVTTYSFPKGNTVESLELRNKWLKSINRDNWTPGKYSCVCINHFSEEFLVREDVMPRADGTILRMARDRIALKEGAYPTIFKFKSSLVSAEVPASSTEPEAKRARLREACEPELVTPKRMASDDIHSFVDFKYCCKDKIDHNWTPIFFDNCVHFLKYDPISVRAEMCLQVKHDLQFEVYCNSVRLPREQFPFMATKKQFLCDKWSKFETLLARLKHWNVEERSFDMCIREAHSVVLLCIQKLKCKVCNNFCNGVCSGDNYENEEKIVLLKKLIFIQEQLDLLVTKESPFSPETLLWAFTLNLENPPGYCNLRDTQILTLPHPVYLKKMSLQLSEPNPTVLKRGLVKYLTEKCKQLSEAERIVNVISDRIPIKSQSKYKNGHVEGDLLNWSKGVTAVQTFMLSSVYSENRDIVGLFPVKNENADQLLECINQVLLILHQTGYTTVSLISGNYQVDNVALAHYGIGRLQVKVENPVAPGKYIFPMFDNNHLLINIRDEWFNQEDETFVFPNFDDFMITEVASVQVLKDLHCKEASSLVKKDLTLSQKVLYPVPAERLNLSFAIKLLDEKVIAAVDKVNNAQGTVKFLQVIQTWWKVVNVMNPPTGSCLTDPYQLPIDSATHDGYQFLVKFERWLRAWEHLAVPRPKHKAKKKHPSGKLRTETFKAVSLSTRALIKICDELLDLDSIHHVPLGKFQSDKIIGSFGLYQQLSGSCRNVSVQKVLESEQKSACLLKLTSATKGAFELTDVLESCSVSVENTIDAVIDATFQSVVCDSDCNDVSTEQIEALIYIGGYAGEKALQSIECSLCRDFLLDSSRQLSLVDLPNNVAEDLRSIGRHSLMYPTEFTMNICLSAFKVFQTLIGSAYEEEFLASSSRIKVLMKLVMERLYTFDIILDINCECGVGMSVLVQKCCSTLANIFLNNYIKLHNDKRLSLRVSNKRKKDTGNAL